MDLKEISDIQGKVDEFLEALLNVKEAKMKGGEVPDNLIDEYFSNSTILEVALSDSRTLLSERPRRLTKSEILRGGIPKVVSNVCRLTGIHPNILNKKTRKREVVEARQLAHHICKLHLKTSLATIGDQIGGKDHATVLHSSKTVGNYLDTDRNYRSRHKDLILMYNLKK